MKSIFLLFSTALFISSAVAAPGSTINPAIQIHQGPDWSWWQVGKDLRLTVQHACSHHYVFVFWPTDPSCESDASFDRIFLDGSFVSYGSALSRQALTLGGRQATSLHFHKSLAAGFDNVIGIDGVEYRLENFKGIFKADRANAYAQEAKDVSEIRFQVTMALIAGVMSLLLIVLLGRYIKRKAPLVVTAFNTSVRDRKIAEIGRIVVDETIRHETRDLLTGKLDMEKSVLREQIAKALKADRTDEAKVLMAVLQRLEGDKVG